jgi:hypothetical protein
LGLQQGAWWRRQAGLGVGSAGHGSALAPHPSHGLHLSAECGPRSPPISLTGPRSQTLARAAPFERVWAAVPPISLAALVLAATQLPRACPPLHAQVGLPVRRPARGGPGPRPLPRLLRRRLAGRPAGARRRDCAVRLPGGRGQDDGVYLWGCGCGAPSFHLFWQRWWMRMVDECV